MPMIQIRMKTWLKNEAEDIFGEIGLDMSTAVRMFFRAVIRERRIPFELSVGNSSAENTDKPVHIQDPDMSGMQFIMPDEKRARKVLHGFQKDGYEAEMLEDPDGWRIRIGDKKKEHRICGN